MAFGEGEVGEEMFKSGRNKVDRKVAVGQFLSAVPYQNTAVKTEPRGEGVLVSVPVRRPKWLIPPVSWILPWSRHRRIELDAPGTEVLGMVDGDRSVEEIIESFAENHKLTFRESQVAVTQFLRQLVQRGVVVVVAAAPSRA